MGIQINGNTNNINAGIGSLSIEDIHELDLTGIATASNFKTGVSNLHNVGLTLSGGQIDVGSNIKIGTAGVITATSFVGSGANLTGLSGVSVANQADNRLITATGTTDALNAEANLTYDGTDLTVTGSNTKIIVDSRGSNGDQAHLQLLAKDASGNNNFGELEYDGDGDFSIASRGSGAANNSIVFKTTSSNVERLRITSGGKVKISNHGTNNLRSLSVLGPKTQIQWGTGEDVGGFLMSETNGQFGLSGGGYWTGSNWVATHTGSAQIRHDGSGVMVFCTNASLTSGNNFVPTERLRITSNGNIGAGGITSPLWTSGGGIHLNDNYGIGFGDGGSGRPDFQLMVTDGSTLQFRCGFGADTADINMDTSGRLLVGTTSPSISSAELFEVKSTASGFSHFRNNSSSYATIYIDNEYSDTGFAPFLTFTDGGGNRGGIGQDNTDLLRITGQGGVSFYTSGSHGSGSERLRIMTDGELRLLSENGNNSDTPGIRFRGGSSTQKANFARIHSRMVSNWGGQLQFKVKNDNGSLSDAYQTAMIMNHNAHVTKPNQPSFHVGSPYNSGMSSGQVWKSHSNAIFSNVGSHYNNSTGRFTAPVDGQYFFFHWGMSNTTGQTNDVYSRKNGSRDQIGTSYNHAASGSHNQFGCSYVRTLSAGDYVDVYVSNGNVYATTDGRHGGWGGWLIG